MRMILRYMAMALGAATIALGASGCASTSKPIGVTKTAPAAVQTAEAAINEARIAIGATAGVIAQHKRDGILTSAERDVFVARLEAAALDVKDAERLKDLGDVTAASKAGAVKSVILLLQKELAAKAKEGK